MHINTVFNQLQSFFPRHKFQAAVSSHNGDRYVKSFTCWQQFTAMLYAQATGKDSLRDIVTGLQVHQSKWYHLGIRNIVRSTLAYANANRSYRIYEEMYYSFLDKCRSITSGRKFRFKNPLYILDSTVIDLCLSMFPWAKFRKAKGGIKLHTLLDSRDQIPEFIVIKEAKRHDVRVAKESDLPLVSDSIIAFDMAYIDFKWLKSLDNKGVYFVTRAKSNMKYRVIGQQEKNIKKGIHSDKTIKLTGVRTKGKYPDELRLIHYYDKEDKKHYWYLTNNFRLAASTIAGIYKARWDVEKFFRWIKQNLKIKTFLGTSKNAVMSQIWIAMIYYLLLTYIKYQTKYSHSLLLFTRIIRETVFERTNLIDLLSLNWNNIVKIRGTPQLELPL